MDDLFESVITKMVSEQFVENQEAISNNLFFNCSEEQTLEELVPIMMKNSIQISVDLASKLVLQILIDANLLKPRDETELRKYLLSVLNN